MKIGVRYVAQLKQAAGVPAEPVELDGPCSVRDLVARLAERHGPPLRVLLLDARGGVQPTLLLFVGDEQADRDRPLRDGDVVTLLAPMAGG